MVSKDITYINMVISSARSKWKDFFIRARDRFKDLIKNRLAILGLIIVVIVSIVAFTAPLIEGYDPLEQNISIRLQLPNNQHILGTDELGRDIWARLVHGTRVCLLVAISSVGIGLIFGIPIGAIAGYYRGSLDMVVMRLMDTLLAFPPILLALGIVATLGSSFFNLVLAIAAGYIPRFSRVIRGSVLAEREKSYVEAGRIIGERNFSILFRQILPNCLSPVIVQATVFLAYAILTEAALSFLGLGTPPPNPSWGSMLNEARPFIESNPHLAIIPGVAISITVLGFNLFGDGLRDILDPRLTEQ
jgi:peptide/nickel transport system permease protein